MSESHRIRLRGPWQIANADSATSKSFNIRSPGDWQNLFADRANADNRPVVARRSFHWTFPQPTTNQIVLVIAEPQCNGVVLVNEHPIGPLVKDSDAFRQQIQTLIKHDNLLQVELSPPAEEDTIPNQPWSDVWLEVS